MTGVISPPDIIKNPKAGVYVIGPLIIQVMEVDVPWRKVSAFNYNVPFPNGVITVFGQENQMGPTGSNDFYWEPISFQVGPLNNSQFRCVINGNAPNAMQHAMIIAIGY